MSAAAQLSLFGEDPRPSATYPERPGFKAVGGASEEASHLIAGGVSRLRAEVLAELAHWPGGKTADELALLLRRDRLSIRPRLSELKALGKVVATGERRKNDSGLSASVWKAVSGGASWPG